MTEEQVPIGAVQHYSFCPRQFALMFLDDSFEANVQTQRGQLVHQTVDISHMVSTKNARVVYALPLYHDGYGLVGRADAVILPRNGPPYPVEYKHGKRRYRLCDELQLTAQALCLEYMFDCEVPRGAIYYYGSRRRREVTIGNDRRQTTQDILSAIRQLYQQPIMPKPVNDRRCRDCSVRDICQPEIVADTNNQRQLYDQLFQPEE